MTKTTYIAVHRIERRVDGKPAITEPGETIALTDDETKELPAAAIRPSKAETATAAEAPKRGRGRKPAEQKPVEKPADEQGEAANGEAEQGEAANGEAEQGEAAIGTVEQGEAAIGTVETL